MTQCATRSRLSGEPFLASLPNMLALDQKKNQKDDENPREFHFPLALRNHNRNVSRSI